MRLVAAIWFGLWIALIVAIVLDDPSWGNKVAMVLGIGTVAVLVLGLVYETCVYLYENSRRNR